MVAATLSVLAAMASGFYVLMLMQTKSSTHFVDSVRAEMMARAGVNFCISQLRAQAFRKAESATDAWYTMDYMRGASKRVSFPDSPLLHNGQDDDNDGVVDNPDEALVDPTQILGYSAAVGASAGQNSDRFTLSVTDAAGKININAGENLAVILDNLCRAIGPPLVAANADALQPRRWYVEAFAGDPDATAYKTAYNQNDTVANRDLYYTLTDANNNIPPPPPNGGPPLTPAQLAGTNRPLRGSDGNALYGDGYAIAGYRARNGAFQSLEDVKNALTYVERNANSTPDLPLEQLEIEVKFAAISPYITINSWVDTNTVCVGKFEWVHVDTGANKTYAIDRDKSWVIDDPVNDPPNLRGSLRGCYLSIMNGHGAGQLRRIRSNGIDWIEVEGGFAVTPGPVSSYMIIANEAAMLVDVNGKDLKFSYPDNPPPVNTLTFPKTNLNGTLVNNPKIDYSQHPLCIHRAPVNVNTATDKVLIALLLGINVQHGHPLAMATDADVQTTRNKWKSWDPQGVQPYLLTPAGLKRIPAASGKLTLTRVLGGSKISLGLPLPPAIYDVSYINNYNNLGKPNFAPMTLDAQRKTQANMTDAHELAYWILMARQTDPAQPAYKYIDPATGSPTKNNTGLLRGPFTNWDDLYFRAIKPWDDLRYQGGWKDLNNNGKMDATDEYHKAKLAPMLMANFNNKTAILKFNPNIEWIDRWGRNFTEQEPLMIYTDSQPSGSYLPGPLPGPTPVPVPRPNPFTVDVPPADPISASSVPICTAVVDPSSKGWGGAAPPLKSGQKDVNGNFITGAYITRNFRYKSDEMIDKTDLNRSTTEFSFDSNGIFEVISIGQVVKGGEVLSERKFYALVKIYDVWRESTQAQFVQGTISKAFGDRTAPMVGYSGQLARDASGLVERKGLVTGPEPLLPLKARNGIDGLPPTNPLNKELVSSVGTGDNDPLDAYGNKRQNSYDPQAKPIDVPEVLANRILPARYDGTITLAKNNTSFDTSQGGDEDCFLATYDGDLDTSTCLGNGREQAKWPCAFDPVQNQYTGDGYKHRCVQCIGLLGRLNDTLIVTDPGLPLYDGKSIFQNWQTDKTNVRWVYPFLGVSAALMPLKLGATAESPSFWNNVILRMGSLRTDGVYLSGPGVAGTNSTLKYLFTVGPNRQAQGNISPQKLNFQPDSRDGNIISMWVKPAWHGNDMRNHEFFNPGNPHMARWCGGFFFQKLGQYKWTSVDSSSGLDICGNRNELNDLFALAGHDLANGPPGGGTDQWIYGSFLHGGYAFVNAKSCPNESPGFRMQPFRWNYLGFRSHYGAQTTDTEAIGPRGHWLPPGQGDFQNQKNMNITLHYVRPFIDTSLTPEGQQTWMPDLFWSYRTCTPTTGYTYSSTGDARDVQGGPNSVSHPDPIPDNIAEGQDVKWVWADPYGKIAPDPNATSYSLKSFGMNNLNYGNPVYNQPFNPAQAYSNQGVLGACSLFWHWHNMPEDGTYAVIDQLKISNKDTVLKDNIAPTPSGNAPPPLLPTGGAGYMQADYSKDRVVREMQTSRYYLPPSPNNRNAPPVGGGPPTFTSQTLLQSLKGFDKTQGGQNVAVVRVSWNVFTPRFMCEYKTPGLSKNFVRQESLTFNAMSQTQVQVPFKGPFDYIKYNDDTYDTDGTGKPPNMYYSVSRPAPWIYTNAKAQPQCGRGVEIELLQDSGGSSVPTVLGKKTFTDPAIFNVLGTADNPVLVYTHQLRYRVRFCYPVDPLVDPGGGVLNSDKNPCVDINKQYLLDTPVFEGISVTYLVPARLLEFREVTE
ncbi:MAG: hypothetical protein ABSE73_02850 [Planctomycetota bacterium]